MLALSVTRKKQMVDFIRRHRLTLLCNRRHLFDVAKYDRPFCATLMVLQTSDGDWTIRRSVAYQGSTQLWLFGDRISRE